ncbi:endonuclease III, putative [Plesiocystis pacifica SIR-1]|uniref:Endonuclease III n=1 Tax=Plesiocystis pacifica SIR-1 TaxID=391625 RepID=A6GGY6_9BACT|nr:endonuclease III [Plesiocystis pacifica]EDM74871.1 endonuclease III, putative [Plesiocystis pacifica SIR-1]
MPAKVSLHPNPAALLSEVDERLAVAMPDPQCELDHDDAWQLLIVTILSAQARDAVINEIRPVLFERWPTPADLAEASQEDVEVVVKRSGYYRNKAKAIRQCAAAIVERHDGEVPQTHDELVALPGASHKTANLVLGVAFGIASGIVVDTHVNRVSARLGLVPAGKKPPVVEKALCKISSEDDWINLSHRLILHGRHLCKSKAPDCRRCPVNELCPSATEAAVDEWKARAEREGVIVDARGDASGAPELASAPADAASEEPPAASAGEDDF